MIVEQTVTTSKGVEVNYDICIFATGSSAFVLPIPGSDLPSVIGWRTIEDTERMIEIAKTKRKASLLVADYWDLNVRVV